MLYGIKRKCWKACSAFAKEPLQYAKTEETGGFDAEKEELHALFGKVPIAVYGSALTKANPADVDTWLYFLIQ